MPKEVWLPVVGWKGLYEVSNLGRIRSLPRTVKSGARAYTWRGCIMRLCPDKDGYLVACFKRRGQRTNVKVHRLVARAFLGKCPAGKQVRHLDGKNNHCAVSNLRYGTPVENYKDKLLHGTHTPGERNSQAKLTDTLVRSIRQEYATRAVTQKELSASYGVALTTISNVLARRTWGHVHA